MDSFKLIGGFAFVLAVGPLSTLDATPASPVPITHDDVTKVWADAWNSHDINAVLALFAKDVQIDQPENPKPLDYAGARRFFSMIFTAYPDFHVAVRQAIVDGRTAVSVEEVTGTWTGPFIDPATGKRTPGNGRHFDHPGAMVISYDSRGQISHVSIYWDQLTVDRQLGILPK
jgi:steroid delta-isomerase-like uncharacterized protein